MAFSSSSSSIRGSKLIVGEILCFGSLAFIADDSAWLADSPLQAQLLPSRGSIHFRADESGALRLQPSAHRQAPALLSVHRKKNRSGRPRAHYHGKSVKVQQVVASGSIPYVASKEKISAQFKTAQQIPITTRTTKLTSQ